MKAKTMSVGQLKRLIMEMIDEKEVSDVKEAHHESDAMEETDADAEVEESEHADEGEEAINESATLDRWRKLAGLLES
jgi:hypothetical protein